MREFNKISAKFWMAKFSRNLKQFGPEAMLLPIYLQTNHHTHSLGIFYLPIEYIAHDIGLEVNRVRDLLKYLVGLGFCQYDFEEKYIWLKDYAIEQAGGALKGHDNRVKQMQKYYAELPALDFLDEFFQIHKDDFHLSSIPEKSHTNQGEEETDAEILTLLEAPLKPLRSTETETKTETKTETETETKLNHIVTLPRPVGETKLVQKIFEHWKQTMEHPNAKLDNNRRRLITQALQLGYDCAQLCQAITGCSKTPHNLGDNDRGQRYDGLHVILRNADQIDRFMRNEQEPPQRLSKSMQSAKATYDSMQDWLNEEGEGNHASK